MLSGVDGAICEREAFTRSVLRLFSNVEVERCYAQARSAKA